MKISPPHTYYPFGVVYIPLISNNGNLSILPVLTLSRPIFFSSQIFWKTYENTLFLYTHCIENAWQWHKTQNCKNLKSKSAKYVNFFKTIRCPQHNGTSLFKYLKSTNNMWRHHLIYSVFHYILLYFSYMTYRRHCHIETIFSLIVWRTIYMLFISNRNI